MEKTVLKLFARSTEKSERFEFMVVGQKRKLLLVEWYDSSHTHGWTRNEPPESALICRSVGWLISTSHDSLTIAPHLTLEDPPQRNGELTIPLCSIIKQRQLDTSSKIED